MLKKNRVFAIIIFTLIMYLTLNPGNITVPIEDLAIPSGIAVDLETNEEGKNFYRSTRDIYTFNKKDEVKDIIISGSGKNIPETVENRQLKTNHKIILGMEKVVLSSENTARKGLEHVENMLFTNEFISDMGWMVVCKGKAADILKLKIADFPTSSDYIVGMMESSREQFFFSDNYKIIDTYVRIAAEGRSLVLPYLELKNNKVQITGTALFKKDKMVRKLNMEETKVMNFLRENNVRGILTLQTQFNKLTSLNGMVKRKVRCEKINPNKYIFHLDLNYSGNVMNNTLYENFLKEPGVVNNFENILAVEVEKKCYEFLRNMQTKYKVDCLELGRVAAAKYGRGTGVDWDKVVSNSEIKVNVKVKVDKFGRGQYTLGSYL